MNVVMMMATLPSPLALLACAMLVGGGARDLMGAATSAAGSGARFTKSFLNSVHALDPVAMLHARHSNAQKTAQHSTAQHSTAPGSTAPGSAARHSRDETKGKLRQADACHWSQNGVHAALSPA